MLSNNLLSLFDIDIYIMKIIDIHFFLITHIFQEKINNECYDSYEIIVLNIEKIFRNYIIDILSFYNISKHLGNIINGRSLMSKCAIVILSHQPWRLLVVSRKNSNKYLNCRILFITLRVKNYCTTHKPWKYLWRSENQGLERVQEWNKIFPKTFNIAHLLNPIPRNLNTPLPSC